MACVDFFVTMRGRVCVNELNTLPGFTDISMYPKLWEEEGMTQTKLIDRLLRLAIDQWKREQKKLVSYE
jgi:D-alanine-D-alanine ligase